MLHLLITHSLFLSYLVQQHPGGRIDTAILYSHLSHCIRSRGVCITLHAVACLKAVEQWSERRKIKETNKTLYHAACKDEYRP